MKNKVKKIEIELENDRKMCNEKLHALQEENESLKYRNKLLRKVNKNVKCGIKKATEDNKLLSKSNSLEGRNKI